MREKEETERLGFKGKGEPGNNPVIIHFEEKKGRVSLKATSQNGINMDDGKHFTSNSKHIFLQMIATIRSYSGRILNGRLPKKCYTHTQIPENCDILAMKTVEERKCVVTWGDGLLGNGDELCVQIAEVTEVVIERVEVQRYVSKNWLRDISELQRQGNGFSCEFQVMATVTKHSMEMYTDNDGYESYKPEVAHRIKGDCVDQAELCVMRCEKAEEVTSHGQPLVNILCWLRRTKSEICYERMRNVNKHGD